MRRCCLVEEMACEEVVMAKCWWSGGSLVCEGRRGVLGEKRGFGAVWCGVWCGVVWLELACWFAGLLVCWWWWARAAVCGQPGCPWCCSASPLARAATLDDPLATASILWPSVVLPPKSPSPDFLGHQAHHPPSHPICARLLVSCPSRCGSGDSLPFANLQCRSRDSSVLIR